MATTYYSKTWYQPCPERREAGVVSVGAKKSISTAAINDIVYITTLPKNARLVPGWSLVLKVNDANAAGKASLIVKDLVSGGSFDEEIIKDLTIGATDTLAFDSTPTFGEQHGWLGKVTDSEDYQVYVKVTTAATGAVTAGNVEVTLAYTLDVMPGD